MTYPHLVPSIYPSFFLVLFYKLYGIAVSEKKDQHLVFK